MRNRLNIYITTQLFMAMSFATFALVGMFWLGQSVPLIEEIILRGESTTTFFKLAALLIPNICKLLIPVAMLIAVVFTMNRLATEGELMAIHNSGQNPMKVLIPIITFGIIITVIHFFIALIAAPSANYSMNQQLFDIETNYTNNFISAKTFVSPEDALYIYAEDSTLEGEMLNVFIDDRREEGFVRNYFAERALLFRDANTSNLALIDGEYHEQELATNQISIGKFDRFEVELDNGAAGPNKYRADLVEIPSHTLLVSSEDWDKNTYKEFTLDQRRGELMDRILFSMLSLIMPIIGAIGFLGAPLSRGGYTNIIVPSVIIGLAMVAFVFSMKEFITSNPSLLAVSFTPFVLTLISLLVFNKRIYGARK